MCCLRFSNANCVISKRGVVERLGSISYFSMLKKKIGLLWMKVGRTGVVDQDARVDEQAEYREKEKGWE